MKPAAFLRQATTVGLFSLLFNLTVAADAPTPPPSKSVVAVGQITSSVPGTDPTSFQTMVETQLIKTNKFRIIERSRLEEILREKGLSMAGITAGDGKISGVSGVDYLI